ncbi:MAG: hypothetical protein L0228_19020 [Planctomycetes bacterium]|nr:hypothetical protein [Planctomycetota bacterium]
MNSETRLAQILAALDQLGWSYLVMGGHAARYYGVSRNTLDYDLHLSLPNWNDLDAGLRGCSLFAAGQLAEGPSWRPDDFRRFCIGRLADGREEWLEFWRRNHLLPPFDELYARREDGQYGGRLLPFLALPDLLRSKETERESDWQDIALLEEILDARNLARATDADSTVVALSQLRSRRGFRQALADDSLHQPNLVARAFQEAASPITRGWLLPALSGAQIEVPDGGVIGEILAGPLKKIPLGSNRHIALVEAIRRLYKQAAVAADRADKLKTLG